MTVWRRSIQSRVVISTLLLSAVVVSLVGWVLLRQITDGLVESKTESSVAESTRATAEAQRRLSAANGNDFDASTQLTQLVSTLVSAARCRGTRSCSPARSPGPARGWWPARAPAVP